MMVVEQVFPIEEGEEYLMLLDVAVDDSPAGESSTAQRRTDAALALARAGRVGLDRPIGGDRYTVHVVADIVGGARAERVRRCRSCRRLWLPDTQNATLGRRWCAKKMWVSTRCP